MKPAYTLFAAALLLGFAYGVFRRIVRQEYARHGRLSLPASTLQLIVMIAYFSFPYLYNPPEWPWFWVADPASSQALHLAGLVTICAGFAGAFGTMAWFGIKRAFGLSAEGLQKTGPYRVSRNPQVLGGYLLVIGTALQRLSLYAFGWLLLYAAIMHWMILTEEEHLLRVYGEEYARYCAQVPRYLLPG